MQCVEHPGTDFDCLYAGKGVLRQDAGGVNPHAVVLEQDITQTSN